MRSIDGQLVLSATDLSNFLNCRHRTALELGEARGRRRRPRFDDPVLAALLARGLEHERRYVGSLRAERVVDLADVRDRADAVAQTLAALASGTDVVVQGALGDSSWYGRPDVLLRTEGESVFGPWAYEVADTKLARETTGGTILQLGLYCAMLEHVQQYAPVRFLVVAPGASGASGAASDYAVHAFAVNDYAAYVRLIRARLEAAVGLDEEALAAAHYPDPVDHCEVCPWSSACSRKRHADDHLSLVAGISRTQRRELEAHDVSTLEGLAALPLPLPFTPARGAVEALERMREQARVQWRARQEGRPVSEHVLPVTPGTGLCLLPPPSPGDLFLDLEGDPFVGDGGREYLFGLVDVAGGRPMYHAYWATTEHEERVAFETVMARIMAAWARDPGMHVYHYAPYEPSAFKRLSCRYATSEADVDRLLRGGRFVDLYQVVRQGVRAGVERYSIKHLEPLYDFAREVPLAEASRDLRVVEQALEFGGIATVPATCLEAVQGYNADDCRSTLALRDWLEHQRAALVTRGTDVPRPVPVSAEPSEPLSERQQRVEALRGRLLRGVPDDAAVRTPQEQARWRLAYLLDFHWREAKAGWWEYYRLLEMLPEELFDEPGAVAGLEFAGRVQMVLHKTSGKPTGSVVDRYRYPAQEMEIRGDQTLKLSDGTVFGKVLRVERDARTLDVRKSKKVADVHPAAAFAHDHVSTTDLEDALLAVGERTADAPDEDGTLAARLLLAAPPVLRGAPFAFNASEASEAGGAADVAVRIVGRLDQTVLAVQGPPGAGKTFTGARMIGELVRQGRRVGVTGPSHAVIRNLLDAVAEAAAREGQRISVAQKTREADDAGRSNGASAPDGPVLETTQNEEALALLRSGTVQVLGATAWVWARPEAAGSVDVLVVDEAGQVSLANAVAVTRATDSLVLLGDPQQLEQPTKGAHPAGVGVSVLQHVLGGALTMPPDRGIFLPETWRLAPAICAFTSELFYERRLHPKAGLDQQRLTGGPVEGAGLWCVEVPHEGNRNASDEEAGAVSTLVARLVSPGSSWVNERGAAAPLTAADILVVAPYNAHVSRVSDALAGTGVRVGTVDKFQGQQAPVVIYTMATSRPEDAPRGLEFLYSRHRLNVATSRAQCAVFLVASPHLFAPECRTPRQMTLANALCRYREMSRL
ncbi:MAG: TM0106 family RecB-like putative nuclease [Vicinamibacterales bacterium]